MKNKRIAALARAERPVSDPFPTDFLWGAATAAFQIEGAALSDGKGPSIWDVYTEIPGKTTRGETGVRACDHYHCYREDVEIMRQLNLRAYRFSISWPRVLPQGHGRVNVAGLDFYDRLVDALCAAGIEPFVTLYHWDLPAALQMELGGWPHPDVASYFADYADICFRSLGDRVRYWVTLNEPWCVASDGYIQGWHAPGVRDAALGYRAGHNLLRAHAHAAARYRAVQRPGPGGLGIALNIIYDFPATETPEDAAAAERAMEFMGGWFGDPLCRGDYPASMRLRLGDLLPPFSAEDAALLRGSLDFIGLNYYFADVVRDDPGRSPAEVEKVPQTGRKRTEMDWPVTPEGLAPQLQWLACRYPGLPLYITENGAAFSDQADGAGLVNDVDRIDYLREHIAAVASARRLGVDIRGYFVWSLMDNLEWAQGFSKRFGLVRCDFETLQRTVKASGWWYAHLIASGGDLAAAAVHAPPGEVR